MNLNKKINIFIVEDNKIFAIALKADIESAFAGMSIDIKTFETGEECLSKFIEVKPQIVILDYHLDKNTPDAANGLTVLSWIKNNNPITYVIMLTKDDNIDIALQSFKHGASDYIVKTDTQFRKIIFSLFNLFRMMESKRDALRYKYMVFGMLIFIPLLIGIVITIQIYNPSLFTQ